ncbi:MAG TPA: PQQ-binding-like beta-propeller repeat protein [Candidatus Nitrosotalea sp.]|nr:PQQ-binding-like beta-propeller repeat protein [Candidatus Nitrosotalea sp.]
MVIMWRSVFTALCIVPLPVLELRASAGWPQWHGPTRDCRVPETEPIPAVLPSALAPVWKKSVGGGHSSPVVAEGKLVYLDENGKDEVAHCLDAKTGGQLWEHPFATRFEDEWGAGPRSTPMIDEDRVYVQSCNGSFCCLKLEDGKSVWSVDFEKDFGVKFLGSKSNEGVASRRGNNGSGIVDGNEVLVPVGSVDGAMLVCFEKRTGKVIWKTGGDQAAYSSPVIATIAGVRQIVYFSADALMGIERTGGKVLWRMPLKTVAQRHAATPVVFGDRVVVNSHTLGTVCFKVSKQNGGFKATEAWRNDDLKINLATPVLVGGAFYNQGPVRDYVCFDAATGVQKWSRAGFGLGKRDYSSTIIFGKNLLVLTEDGTLLLLAANPEKYTELGRVQVCGNTWSFPAYTDGKLYVRDARQLVCYDLLK